MKPVHSILLLCCIAFCVSQTDAQFVQQGDKLVGTGSVGNATQGVSVSLSADGNTAIAGGHADNNGAGAVWVFTRNGSVWGGVTGIPT